MLEKFSLELLAIQPGQDKIVLSDLERFLDRKASISTISIGVNARDGEFHELLLAYFAGRNGLKHLTFNVIRGKFCKLIPKVPGRPRFAQLKSLVIGGVTETYLTSLCTHLNSLKELVVRLVYEEYPGKHPKGAIERMLGSLEQCRDIEKLEIHFAMPSKWDNAPMVARPQLSGDQLCEFALNHPRLRELVLAPQTIGYNSDIDVSRVYDNDIAEFARAVPKLEVLVIKAALDTIQYTEKSLMALGFSCKRLKSCLARMLCDFTALGSETAPGSAPLLPVLDTVSALYKGKKLSLTEAEQWVSVIHHHCPRLSSLHLNRRDPEGWNLIQTYDAPFDEDVIDHFSSEQSGKESWVIEEW